jgi:RimJ/RimL family protein N-acetyltransferase
MKPAPHPAPAISLRRTTPEDLPRMFELQADPASNAMAGTKPRTREAFFATWDKIFANPRVNGFVIEMDVPAAPTSPTGRELVGSIACFQASEVPGEPEIDCVGYWIARSHWGKGIASAALAEFLKLEPRRPLHATADRNNAASRRILEKCGFRCTGYRTGEETDRYLACELADFVLES